MGTDRYRLSGAGELRDSPRLTGTGVLGREEFLRVCDYYFEHYFTRAQADYYRKAGMRPVIVAYSYRAGPPGDRTYEPDHLAPIIAVARKHGCDVCVVHPAEGGMEFQWAWRQALEPQGTPKKQ